MTRKDAIISCEIMDRSLRRQAVIMVCLAKSLGTEVPSVQFNTLV